MLHVSSVQVARCQLPPVEGSSFGYVQWLFQMIYWHRVSKTIFVLPFIIVAWSCYQGVLCYGKAILLFPLWRSHSVSCVIFSCTPFCMPFLTWVLHLDLGFPSGHLFNIFLCLPVYVTLLSSFTLFLNNLCPWFNQLIFYWRLQSFELWRRIDW